MLITREQPSPVSPDTQPPSTEAVLGIHRNDLKPEVRAYADNLRDQVREIFRTHNVKTVDEFSAAARVKKIPLEKVREVQVLLGQLARILEKNEIDEPSEFQELRSYAESLSSTYIQSLAFSFIASVEAECKVDASASLLAARKAANTLPKDTSARIAVDIEFAVASARAGRDATGLFSGVVALLRNHARFSEPEKYTRLLPVIDAALSVNDFYTAEKIANLIGVYDAFSFDFLRAQLALANTTGHKEIDTTHYLNYVRDTLGKKLFSPSLNWERAGLLIDLALAAVKNGEIPGLAFTDADALVGHGLSPRERHRYREADLCLARIQCLGARGVTEHDFILARRAISFLENEYDRPKYFMRLAILEQQLRRDVQETLALALKATDKLNTDAYGTSRNAYALACAVVAGETAKLGLFEESYRIAEGIDVTRHPVERTIACADIARAEISAGQDPARALKWVAEALRSAPEHDDVVMAFLRVKGEIVRAKFRKMGIEKSIQQ